jgi:hypothetical protein
VNIEIRPEPSPEEREAILKAVRELLRREEAIAKPATWTLAGWTHKRTGVTDLARWVPNGRRWALSARLPHGGREYTGLQGRGDSK